MNVFKKLFSLEPDQIKPDVIITPYQNLDNFKRNKRSEISRGLLFEVLTERDFCVIKTGIGASFVGDAVMYLKNSPCERIYFVGSCGAVQRFNIGDLVIPGRALAWESFSQILGKNYNNLFIGPKKKLSEDFLKFNKDVKPVVLVSIGSLNLEEQLLPKFKQKEIDVVDMEVSAFFSAANYLGLPSLALLYVTDIILEKPFYRDLNKNDLNLIKNSRQRAISLICDFIRLRRTEIQKCASAGCHLMPVVKYRRMNLAEVKGESQRPCR